MRNIPGMAEITWEQVERRRAEHEARQDDYLKLDSSQSGQDLLALALRYIQG